jgi:hypothetical protein
VAVISVMIGEMTLSELIAAVLAAKPGEEFMLYFWPGGKWTAGIVNPDRNCALGEASPEFSSAGATPEEAITKLLEVIR